MQKSTPTNDVKKAIVHNGEKLVIDKQIANAFAQHCALTSVLRKNNDKRRMKAKVTKGVKDMQVTQEDGEMEKEFEESELEEAVKLLDGNRPAGQMKYQQR